MGNLLLGLSPKKFCKFVIFPGESSSPHRDTEIGCNVGMVLGIGHNDWLNILDKSLKSSCVRTSSSLNKVFPLILVDHYWLNYDIQK